MDGDADETMFDEDEAGSSQMPPPKRKGSSKRNNSQASIAAPKAKKARRQQSSEDDESLEPSPSSSIAASQALSGSEKSMYARSGKVARMVLKNFMCHSNFAVDFNDHKNLMVGKNGSGKSAVLTALIVGLGSKASATSRCSSMKQLIKRGETSGSIEIHLFNFPDDGYEYDKYGSRIIIVRQMNASGSSTYKIKNAQGHVKSSSRNELNQLLMYLNIQVDNPVCVLNQDASRSFLRDSDPKKRFQLFMKATQIETVMDKLNACSVHVQNAKNDLKYQKELAESYEKELNDAQERYERLQSVSLLKQQVLKLKREQAWLYVIEQEEYCSEMQKQLDELEAKCSVLRSACSSKAAMELKIKEYMDAFVAERDALLVAKRADSEAYESMRSAFARKQEVHQELQRNMAKVMQRQKQLEANIADVEKAMSEHSESHATQVERTKEANERKLARLVEQKEELVAMADSARRDTQMLINTKSQEQDQCDQLNDRKRAIRYNCDKIVRSIKECESSGKDTLLVYGSYMPRLIAAVEALFKRGAFTAMPRGPLGRYIELDDDKWKMAIENILGGLVYAFAVNDAKDRSVLTQLIKRDFSQHSRHSIITSRFTNHVYDVRSGAVRPPTNTRLAMDVLRVRDPVVMNCLIDNCKVETILLSDDEQVAMRLTSDEENVPRGLARIILIKPFTVFYPAPNYRSYSLDMRHAQFLQVDMSQRREMLQEELDQLKRTMDEMEQTINSQRQRLDQITRTLGEKNDQKDKLQNALAKIQNDIIELEAIEYPSQNEGVVLRKELEELQTCLEENEEIVNREKERYETQSALLVEKKKEIDELQNTLRAKEQQIRDIQTNFDNGKRALDEDLVNVKYGEQKVRAIETEIAGSKKEYDRALTKQTELTTIASDLGERIERRHTHEQLAAKMRKGESRIATASSGTETIEQLEQSVDIQRKRFQYTTNLVEVLQETLQKLHVARKARYNGLSQLKTHMSLRIQCMFNNLLKLRDYSGELKIDHANQTLELSVVPRDKNIENAVSNAKSLSGGERSYTTIAMLLSLWACVDYPFYFLDEYDVFTDQVNRHYITKLLFSEADKKKHRQYTFLTPQDMSNIEASDKLCIHRLAEPER